MGKFHAITVKPTITASRQTSAFADGDVMFDWTSFDIPKGANKLINVTALMRGTDGVAQSFALNRYFAKTLQNPKMVAPGSLGDINGSASGTGYQNHLIGTCQIEESDLTAGTDIVSIGNAQFGARMNGPNIVLQGEPDSGSNVGYDKLYVAGITPDGDPSFASTVQVSTETATSTAAVVVKTTSALTNFDKGDVLTDEDDLAIGTIKTVTDATNLVLEANCASVSAVNKDLYNINPITLILSFEK